MKTQLYESTKTGLVVSGTRRTECGSVELGGTVIDGVVIKGDGHWQEGQEAKGLNGDLFIEKLD